ncbi:MAG: hypothetical protein ACOCR6_03170 [archaeon]
MQDCDVASVDPVGIGDATARTAHRVRRRHRSVPEDRVLRHELSDTAFDSATHHAGFNRGETAACEL